jgi:imidazolonepropionase-like amidohydrolase
MGLRQGRGSWQLVFQALEEARLNGTVHVESDIAPLTMMMDGSSGVEHPFYIRIYDDVANLVAQSGTTHTQTFLSVFTGAYTKRHYGDLWGWGGMRRFTPPSVRPVFCPVCVNLERGSLAGAAIDIDNLVPLLGNAKREVAKGGHVGLGSHGDMSGIGIHYEMWAYALGGMPNHDVLRTATIEGARAIGHARDLGSLEVGKLADLQILDKNPLEDIHNTTRIRYVMKNGRLYEAGDLTQIWPEFKPLPRIYIWANTRADSTQAATAAHH